MIKTPNRKSITSAFIACNALSGEICPVNSTTKAPSSIICQIRNLILPPCRTAIRIKTTARVIIEIIQLDWYMYLAGYIDYPERFQPAQDHAYRDGGQQQGEYPGNCDKPAPPHESRYLLAQQEYYPGHQHIDNERYKDDIDRKLPGQ